MRTPKHQLFLLFVLLLVSCNRNTERIITVVNKSNIDLKDIWIQSSSYTPNYGHGFWSKKPSYDRLEVGDLIANAEKELIFKGNINEDCLTMSSDSLSIIHYDCMSEDNIDRKQITIHIKKDGLKIQD